MTQPPRPNRTLHPSRRDILIAGAATLAVASSVRAQSWPGGPITIVVPSSPGSGPDVIARMLAEKLGVVTKSTVVVENKSGANDVVGASFVAKAAPDARTLLLYDRLTLSVNPLLLAKLPYDPKALSGVSDIANVDLIFVCRADSPYRTWSEMIAHARTNPGKLSVGTAGPGSVHHLSLEMIKRNYRVEMTDVPYKGIAPAVTGLLGGELECVITGQETVLQHIRAGKLRALAIGATRRSALLPDVPTLEEAGAPGDLLIPTSFTLFAPAAVPAATLKSLHTAVLASLQDKVFVDRLAARGLIVAPSSPAAQRPSRPQLHANR